MVIVQLSNGKRIANFSSNHPFKYTDGTILPAVSDAECRRLAVQVHDEPVGHHGDVLVHFWLTSDIRDEMAKWTARHRGTEVDYVICPLMMIRAIAKERGTRWLENSPFRCIRIQDRTNGLCAIDKQCLIEGDFR